MKRLALALWGFLKNHALGLVIGVAVAVVAIILLHGFGSVYPSQTGAAPLAPADSPPLEYIYLDSARVADYLGQLENGLSASEQRTESISQSINASLSAGTAAQVGASEQAQEGTQSTVTPTAADRYYQFVRLLRNAPEAKCQVVGHDRDGYTCSSGTCNTDKRADWLGEVNDQAPASDIVGETACIGVGNFVRITNAQLFVPPFAQALPRAQSADAFYGDLPSPRTAFTSPTQSAAVRGTLARYAKLVGPNPRLPFVAAPYGFRAPVGQGVTFFLPVRSIGLTAEPALLSGSVTILGKIVYEAPGGQAYIDYPTINEFGQPLQQASPTFLDALGVCSKTPPPQTQPHRAGAPPSTGSCTTHQQTLDAVKASVTFKPPVIVVLPLAIYQ